VEINTKINLLAYVNPAVMAKEPPQHLWIYIFQTLLNRHPVMWQ